MAYQTPYNASNFMGLHAGDAAATAWIKANHWDASHDGLGNPQVSAWYWDTAALVEKVWSGAWVVRGAVSGTTLDAAYDMGGAGLGRSITADSGAVDVSVPIAVNGTALAVHQLNPAATADVCTVENLGASGASIGLAGTRRWIESDSADATFGLVANDANAYVLHLSAVNTGAGTAGIGIGADDDIDITSATGCVTIHGFDTGTVGVEIEAVAGGGTVNIGAVNLPNQLNLGTGGARPVLLGSVTGAASTDIRSGTGALTVTAGGIVDVNATGAVTIDAAGASAITIGGDVNTGAIGLGTGAAARAITLGNVSATTGVTVNTGTAGFTVNTTGAGTVDVNGTAAVSIESTGGAIEVGAGANAYAVNLGTGGAARTVTVGSTNTTSALALQAGTGLISFVDGYKAGGGYAGALYLALNAAEYTTYEANFGEVSLINAINQCASSSVTLDEAYTAGQAITVDLGAVTMTVPNTLNSAALALVQSDATNNPSAMTIANAGTGASLYLSGATRLIQGASGLTITGGTAAGNDLTLLSTSHGTKGSIFFGAASEYDSVNARLGINKLAPAYTLDINGNANVASTYSYLYDGAKAIFANTTVSNWFFGEAGNATAATTNQRSTAVGKNALSSLSTGTVCTAVGYGSARNTTTPGQITAYGYGSSYGNTTGTSNCSFGYNSAFYGLTNNYCCSFGDESLYDNVADGCSAFGYRALRGNTSGIECTAVGRYALRDNTTGDYQVGVGYAAAVLNKTGKYLTAIGYESLHSIDGCDYSTALGFRAGAYYGSGVLEPTSATQSTFIGAQTRASADGNTNETVIGYNAIGNGSNTVTLGNSSVTGVYTSGRYYSSRAGTAKAVSDFLTLTNTGNAADMDGTGIRQLFNLYYYDATTPAVWDAGAIVCACEGDATSTAATQDSYIALHTSLDGTLAEKLRIDSAGNVGVGLTAFGTSAAKVIGVASGTAPTTSPADAIQLYATDFNAVAGTAALHVVSEDGSLTVVGNNLGLFRVGGEVIDATARGTLFIGNYTAPSAHTDNGIYIYSADSDGDSGSNLASLALYTEEPVLSAVTTSDRALPIQINGVAYLLLLAENVHA